MTTLPGERRRLQPDQTMALLIDWQERLVPAMPDAVSASGLENVLRVLGGASLLQVPAVVTEQYPKGMGPTVAPVLAAHPELVALPKITFSCLADERVRAAILATGRRKVLVMGMETHICVYQTVLDLLDEGLVPHVVADACVSRRKENWRRGLALCQDAGAVITSAETALFQLLGKAGGDAFKAISRSIR